MERTADLLLLAISIFFLVSFVAFALVSWREKEQRASRTAMLMAILGGGFFCSATSFSQQIKLGTLMIVGVGLLAFLVLFLLPIGKIKLGNDIPSYRFDERDMMFARARLVPGSSEYQRYYAMHPENKAHDDATRAKPGMLSPKSKMANPFLFASPDASFTLTDAMRTIVDGPVTDEKLALPIEQMTEYITGLAHYYGALEVGITKLEPYHVYSHIGRGDGVYGTPIEIEHTVAIAFTVEMDHEMIGANPTAPGLMESAKQYVESGRVGVQLAEVIRQIGYPARAHIDGNYRVIAPLVARDAGLGELSRMGLMITPNQGPRVRLGAVTTTLPLTITPRTPNLAVIDFCKICKKCAENCPSNSISFDDRQEVDGTLRWRINPDSCFAYWNVIGTDCGICMAVCPYSHPNTLFHNATRWGIQRSGFFRRTALWLDDAFYGKKPTPRTPPAWTQVP